MSCRPSPGLLKKGSSSSGNNHQRDSKIPREHQVGTSDRRRGAIHLLWTTCVCTGIPGVAAQAVLPLEILKPRGLGSRMVLPLRRQNRCMQSKGSTEAVAVAVGSKTARVENFGSTVMGTARETLGEARERPGRRCRRRRGRRANRRSSSKTESAPRL